MWKLITDVLNWYVLCWCVFTFMQLNNFKRRNQRWNQLTYEQFVGSDVITSIILLIYLVSNQFWNYYSRHLNLDRIRLNIAFIDLAYLFIFEDNTWSSDWERITSKEQQHKGHRKDLKNATVAAWFYEVLWACTRRLLRIITKIFHVTLTFKEHRLSLKTIVSTYMYSRMSVIRTPRDQGCS